jgi:hypothetical protein
MGPERYAAIAEQYRPLTAHQDRLGVDINFVERDQVVYPTQQQTGTEVAELIHVASQSFPTVIYYSASTLLPVDVPILPVASAIVTKCERSSGGGKLVVDSPLGVEVRWSGPVSLDEHPWPARAADYVLVPPGRHTLQADSEEVPVRLLDFNGTLETAAAHTNRLEIAYTSQSRALAKLDRIPARLLVDGQEATLTLAGENVVFLPRGRHVVVVEVK